MAVNIIPKKPAPKVAGTTIPAPTAAIKKPAPGAPTTVVKAGQATINKQLVKAQEVESEEVEQEEVGAPEEFASTPAMVSVSLGMTRSLGAGTYEFAKFDVSLTMPSDVNVKSLQETYEFAKAWVDEKVATINTEIDEQLGVGEEE